MFRVTQTVAILEDVRIAVMLDGLRLDLTDQNVLGGGLS